MVNVDYIAIGRRIREKRKEAGLSQKELAVKVGLSTASISKYEHGKVEDATHSMLIQFAMVLHVSVSWLLGIHETSFSDLNTLSSEEQRLLDNFRMLTQTGKDYILQTMNMAIITYNKSNQKKNA